ncbi:MAG TPA: hypothetical protein VEY95_12000 [Azospirillaceae bacterium]|nr:hypothetical protein [Azospirillaceae bacterium]
MRSFEGQMSDNRKIKRTPEQLRAAIEKLKVDLSVLKAHAAPGMRENLQRRIKELEAELADTGHGRRRGGDDDRPGAGPTERRPMRGSRT